MDDFRSELNKCGCGGIKCPCCRPTNQGHKDKDWTRQARSRLKRKTKEEIESENEKQG